MIEETAIVVAVEGDETWVETERQTTCGSCSVNKGCGTATLAKVLGNKRNRVRVINTIGASVGERVVVGIEEAALLKGSLAVYLVPILGLLLGGIFGEFMAPRLHISTVEWLGAAGAIGGLSLGLLWLRFFARQVSADGRYQAKVLKRVTQGNTGFTGVL